MHEVLNSFKQQLSQKFHKNFINFEKSQKFSKIPKVRSKGMKCMIKWESKKKNKIKVKKLLGMKIGVREKSLGGEKVESNWER